MSRCSLEPRPKIVAFVELMPYAEHVASQPESRHSHVGFFVYGSARPGDRALIAVDSEYDERVPAAVARALKARGAKVDVITVDVGPGREFDELEEIRVSIRSEAWARNPRRWEGIAWSEYLAKEKKYDLLTHGKGGPVAKTDCRHEMIPYKGKACGTC